MDLAPNLYSITQLNGIFVHAFIVDDGDGLTLVDTLHDIEAKPIFAELDRIGRKPADIKRILLTHGHRAHLGGLAAIQAASGAPVYAHEWEADIVSGDRRQQCNTLRPMRPYRLWFAQFASRFGKSAPGCTVDHLISDGDQVGPLQVVAAPGHTPGHLAFYWPAGKAIFASDALVNYPEFGPGWAFFMLNFKQNDESLVKMSKLDIEVLGVGHGDPIPSGGGDMLRGLVKRLGLV
jgi:glyoxylase-like metal-dependent hydrolase (beta-lactamase superfamily II)